MAIDHDERMGWCGRCARTVLADRDDSGRWRCPECKAFAEVDDDQDATAGETITVTVNIEDAPRRRARKSGGMGCGTWVLLIVAAIVLLGIVQSQLEKAKQAAQPTTRRPTMPGNSP